MHSGAVDANRLSDPERAFERINVHCLLPAGSGQQYETRRKS
jgi:hypothetical protein